MSINQSTGVTQSQQALFDILPRKDTMSRVDAEWFVDVLLE